MNRSIRVMWIGLILLIMPVAAQATVEWELVRSLDLDSEPVDLALSQSGKYLYVLTRAGEVKIFESSGQLKGTLNVGKKVYAIRIGPDDTTLFLINSGERKIQIADLSFIYTIPTAGSPVKGPPDAPVDVVVFSDFQCPHCARLVPLLEEVHRLYPDQVKIVFKNFPLRMHPYALKAAFAAMAADKMSKFWEFHDKLFQNYAQLNDEKITQIAKDLGLDVARWKALQKSPEVRQRLQSDINEAQAADVDSTPSVFIDGRLVKRRNLSEFQKIIDAELKHLGKQ